MTVTSTLNEQFLLDIVRQATAIVMEVSAGELDGETHLIDDLNADSLALIEIVEVTEDCLRAAGTSVRVDDGTLSRLMTLGELVAALRHEIVGQQSETEV